MVIGIKGVSYKIRLLSKAAFIKKYKDEDVALLDKSSRTMIFRKDHIKKNIVIHEVVHSFIDSLHLASCSDISLHDFEEIICEMLEVHLMDINRTANEIMAYLKSVK